MVLITGASSGLGLAAADGSHVSVRQSGSPSAAGSAASRRARESSSAPATTTCTWGALRPSQARVRPQVAGRFREQAARLDVLVNNAGVLTPERAVSPDGIELTLATNVVGPFLLTNLLIRLLEESAPARISNVSSGGMYTQKLRVDDLQSERGQFHGPKVYARTKRGRVGDRALAGLRRTLAPSQPQTLSSLSGRALDGKEYELPGDLAKPYNFLVVAFRREQQRVVDQWLPW
ncbi:MAG TPA: SDR family NAD(P)-dependent oxidoreductase, partial [Solirubrobacteraceae bacterium]|nr:SDR family NAD(P)-dependent oxidoreductase [Solirubrobacteraceae bacterium]